MYLSNYQYYYVMKESVSDIVDILREAYQNGAVLKKRNEELKEENETLRNENVSLKERLAHYEKPLSDSHNSNTSPSGESLKAQAIRRTRSLRTPSGRKTGGQVGHKGGTLVKSDQVDEVQTHSPSRCKYCGHSLQEIAGVTYETRQSIDIPLPVRPRITEHIGIEKRCTCGHCNRADFPSQVKPGVSYGVNIHALVAYLSTAQHIPFKRLVEVLNDFYGLKMSQGSVSNILNRMWKQGLSRYDEIKQEILSSHSGHLFLFLENPNVPPDNNASERAIRPLKVKQKVSGQFKSDEGASAFCVIHSIVHTAKKKDQDPFLALREIAENVINHQT